MYKCQSGNKVCKVLINRRVLTHIFIMLILIFLKHQIIKTISINCTTRNKQITTSITTQSINLELPQNMWPQLVSTGYCASQRQTGHVTSWCCCCGLSFAKVSCCWLSFLSSSRTSSTSSSFSEWMPPLRLPLQFSLLLWK